MEGRSRVAGVVGKGAEDEVVDGREVRDNDAFCWREKTEESQRKKVEEEFQWKGFRCQEGEQKRVAKEETRRTEKPPLSPRQIHRASGPRTDRREVTILQL